MWNISVIFFPQALRLSWLSVIVIREKCVKCIILKRKKSPHGNHFSSWKAEPPQTVIPVRVHRKWVIGWFRFNFSLFLQRTHNHDWHNEKPSPEMSDLIQSKSAWIQIDNLHIYIYTYTIAGFMPRYLR